MEYDRIKDRIESILGHNTLARKLFFAALDRLFLRARYVRREIDTLKKSGFNPSKILDAGSGFGQYSFRLARTFPQAQVIGLDLKEQIVDSGNRLAVQFGVDNIKFEKGDLLSMDHESQYDMVLNVDVLEHIEEDRKVIENIGRILKPGGLFVLTTPYFDEDHPVQSMFVDEHVRPGYSRKDLEEKLNSAGLELRKFTITYGSFGGVAWRLLQKWPMSWLSGRIWLLPLVLIYFCAAYPIAWIFMQLDMMIKNTHGGGILAVAVRR